MLSLFPVTLFEAKSITRHVKVTNDGLMTIRVRTLTWLLMSQRYKEGRPIAVTFPLNRIRSGWYRPASWCGGCLYLNVPYANDPWQRRTDRHRKKNTYPKPKPHRIRFTRKQQPAFELCAHEIGVS